MRVLVACEFSGIVRDAFGRRGHDAWSCDLLQSEKPCLWHYTGPVEDILFSQHWDLLVAHPPCTYLSGSGVRWLTQTPKNPKPGVLYGAERRAAQVEAIGFVRLLLDAPVERIALENPVSMISSLIRKPDQIVQPWMFGHGETKATCLWLKNLPKLEPTKVVAGRAPVVHHMSPGPERWRERSRTYQGIANAMAAQWGES